MTNDRERLPAVVIGGGITGLTTAYRLAKSGAKVVLVEASGRLGGVIRTERSGDFVIEAGADSFVATRPHATALCKELGLGDRLIGTRPENRRVYVGFDGELHSLPEGMVLAVPTRVMPLARSRLFSWTGKARMGLDLVLPRKANGEDESLGHFLRRRLGDEMLERLAGPLLGGIYSGDVDKLSVRATFPQLVELEEKYGSLVRGALAQRKNAPARAPSSGPPPSMFLSLKGGMEELVETLAKAVIDLGVDVRRATHVDRVVKRDDGALEVHAHGPSGEAKIGASSVVLAIPAYHAASIVEGVDAEAASVLRETPYLSTATIAFAFDRKTIDHPLDATGVILPKQPGAKLLALTFVSSKWEGRAPRDVALVRAYLGGHRDPEATKRSDEELVATAKAELAAIVGAHGEPLFAKVFRYERLRPQPVVGHKERLAKLDARASAIGPIFFAGAAYDGVGIPDCVRQAEDVAKKILARGA